MTRASDTLVEAKRIIAIDVPAGRRNSRLKRYRIANSYLRFWFRFVEPQLRNIEVGRSDLAIAALAVAALIALRRAPRLGFLVRWRSARCSSTGC